MVRKDPIFEARTNVKVSRLLPPQLRFPSSQRAFPRLIIFANPIAATLQQAQERGRPCRGDFQI